jgi:uncharacterized protein (TIGR02099 family)
LKYFSYKWLRRFYLLIAVKLFIVAMCLTLLRVLFMSVSDYKEDLVAWVANEYNINISVADVSAGVDFSGLILILNDINLADSEEIPFSVTTDYLFIHLDLWDSLVERTLNFKRISLIGVDLTLKEPHKQEVESEQSLLTLDSLQTVFLQHLNQFSVRDSYLHFKNYQGVEKTVAIDKLRWLNDGELHQGVGSASLPESLGHDSLQFVIDLAGEQGEVEDPLQGKLYLEADNLNITDYLTNRVNANAQIIDAVMGFQIWAEFSSTQLHQAQVVFNDSKISWTQGGRQHRWQINSGQLQLTNSEHGWLFDSYDLDVEHNQKKLHGLAISGHGSADKASLNFSDLYAKDLLPFYLLRPGLTASQISLLQALDIDADLIHLDVRKDQTDKLHFATQLKAFKNRPHGAFPGLSNAQINVQGNLSEGAVEIQLPEQKIYFDGQFTRPMPVKSGDLRLQWAATPAGLKLFSEQSLLKTSDLDTITEFSLLFPNKEAQNRSPFLSLYTYASLNDAAKAQYYYPVKALKEKVFGYLQPTLKKGTVEGAQILWYGTLNHYPYRQNDGIFQAWVPLRDAQYDFYGQWQGLTDLDLDLLFENDWLTMDALQASLGEVKLQKLMAKIDHLNPRGILSIDADINGDAQKISDYLKDSPLKASVGETLTIIDVQKNLSGNLQLTIPLTPGKQKNETIGEVTLSDNDIDIKLADDFILPLKNVQGQFNFTNGNLIAENMTAQLFEQDLQLSFDSIEKKKTYQVNVDLNGVWKLQQLSRTLPELSALQLSGDLDWTGDIHFKHYFTGGYESRVALSSATQGLTSKLPFPFNKNALHSWPTEVMISGDNEKQIFKFNIKDKLDFIAQLDTQSKQKNIPYYTLNIGKNRVTAIDRDSHIIKVNLEQLNIGDWYRHWNELDKQDSGAAKASNLPLPAADQILVDIKHASIFEQPLTVLKINAVNDKQKWVAKIDSHNLQADVEYRPGVPIRLDLDIAKLDFKTMDLSAVDAHQGELNPQLMTQSNNLQTVYPEIFAKCSSCLYGDYDLSPMQLHIYPNKSLLNIDYINIGTEKEFTNLSGVWDQRRTNVTINSLADDKNNIVKRLGYVSPVVSQRAELNGTLNWLGAPWQFNFESLNGDFSSSLKDGSITEVSDKGARILGLLSLNAIRHSLNLEFNDIFAKGLNFDDLTLSAKIQDGIIKNNDFYLDGSAGKITGSGEVDLPNYQSNYLFSYSPAVTSSLPVLTAFAVNPLTGAAVLFLTKILEPVVETIIRVDFSVQGSLKEPVVELVGSEKGKVKLQNSEVLKEINKLQTQEEKGNSNNE